MRNLILAVIAFLFFTSTAICAETTMTGTFEYFYSSKCESCDMQKPIMEKWFKDNETKLSKVAVEKINVESETVKALGRGYKNQPIPYFQIRNRYGEVIANGQGVQSENQLTSMVELLKNASDGIEFIPQKKTYKKNGKEIRLNAAPFIKKGRTYVPLRPLANSLGIEDKDIGYKDGVITLKKGDIAVKLETGQKTIKIGEALKEIDVAPEIVKGSSFLPAKYIAEAFGYIVKWKDGKVIITEPVNMVTSRSVPDIKPVMTEGEDSYYDFVEMLIIGGLKKEEISFENEDTIIIENDSKWAGVLLTDSSNKLYLIAKDKQCFKYELTNNITKKGDKWLVKNDDATKTAMLGTILEK